ncbi:ankyrin repeat-containing domain, PGG domain protein [Tanacetum coccineum]
MSFSSKWRSWIHACLNLAFALVLLNVSPTKEFKIKKGLRQGDPLSPLLFILTIKAFNVALLYATSNNIFKGIKVGKDMDHISHLQFEDDALIIGEWSRSNAMNLSRILTCFHLASGLKVNFKKLLNFHVLAWEFRLEPRCQDVTIGRHGLIGGVPFGAVPWMTTRSLGLLGKKFCPLEIMGYLLVSFGPEDTTFPLGLLFQWPWRGEPSTTPELEALANLVSLVSQRMAMCSNLDRRDLDSVRCPLCDDEIETEEHIFFHYAGKEDYFKYAAPLYEASIQGDWKSAKTILDEKPELVRYSITENQETALHVAASANRSKQVVQFVKNLVGLMQKDDLALRNKNRSTTLYLAAASGNLETVKIMLEKNETLHTIRGAEKRTPLYAAALFGSKDVVKHLYSISKDSSDESHSNAYSRSYLLERCVQSDMFDIALDIVKQHPTLARRSELLAILAQKPEAFSKSKSSVLKGTVNSVFAFIGLKKEMPEEKESQALELLKILWEDIVKLPKKEIDGILRGPQDPIEQDNGPVLQAIQLKELICEQLEEMENTCKNEHPFPELKKLVSRYVLKMHTEAQNIIKEENKTRSSKGDQALELEKIISKNIVKLFDDSQIRKSATGVKTLHGLISNHISVMRRATRLRDTYSNRVVFIAAKKGNTKFIVELIRKYPDLIWKFNDEGFSIFHIAVRHRHAGIYSLLYEIGAMKDMITPLKDTKDNNMLHLVAETGNQKQLKNVSGALEMQRELLWFQEVESIVPPYLREQRNSDGLTPHELFTKEHKDMVTQGEKWMKEIASQCMVVAALIATMVFAAAFTVPGGYDQNNGIPIFYSKTTFKVFVVADAISLFSSSASILYMFLSVFTARYAERDFLESLPQKLIVGLSFLFLSMTSMIVAFCVSFFVLYEKGLLWIPILISVFALIPFGIYVRAQYALFLDVVRSTYGSRIPLTKFFVAVLKYFRIHISQLSPFGAARVSHFEVLTRVLDLALSVAVFRAVFPISVPLYMGDVLEKDPAPHLTARQEQTVQTWVCLTISRVLNSGAVARYSTRRGLHVTKQAKASS